MESWAPTSAEVAQETLYLHGCVTEDPVSRVVLGMVLLRQQPTALHLSSPSPCTFLASHGWDGGYLSPTRVFLKMHILTCKMKSQ